MTPVKKLLLASRQCASGECLMLILAWLAQFSAPD